MQQQQVKTALRGWLDDKASALTRALFPKVMEFKVISREREKHEFMPVVYVIDRSESWRKRVPAYIERDIVRAYITPLVLTGDKATDANAHARKLTLLADELRQRTRLMDLVTNGGAVCIDEAKYKLGVFVDYSSASSKLPATTREKSDLYQVVRVIANTLEDAKHQRVLVVPVSMHYCSSGSFVSVRRFAGIRYGAPVLLEQQDIVAFREGPAEFTQHISARLIASLKMQPPSTAAQMEILRLSRTLHVYCAKVFRDDCFSRRQIASMNEEILQIHFRTRNHPDMHLLKEKMIKYCRILKKWRLRDEDINAAAVQNRRGEPTSPVYIAWTVASVLQRVLTAPGQLLLSGACDLVYRPPPQRKLVATAAMLSAFCKCALALVSLGVLFRIAQSKAVFWGMALLIVLLVVFNKAKDSLGYREVAQHLKKVQFYFMDSSELQELKATRAVLARRIHALVAQYVITDLPPPVLQDRSKASADDTVLPDNEYTLNPHHKIFINAPRSYPLAYVSEIKDAATVRRVVYAPKMLRDETWRTIYETLAPKHLRFSALLVHNKGDNLPMVELLATPFFNAVLTAYVKYQIEASSSCSDEERDHHHHDLPGCDVSITSTSSTCSESSSSEPANAFGDFGSADEVIDIAMQLAQEEDELSS